MIGTTNMTIVPAQPGFYAVEYDERTGLTVKTPIIAWQIQTWPDAEPRAEGITADPYKDSWFVLTPDGEVIDSMTPECRWDTIESFVEDMAFVDEVANTMFDEKGKPRQTKPSIRRRPCHLRLVRDPDAPSTLS